MPEIKLQHVVSCSSEDKNYPSENLIHGAGYKKWKSGAAGEKQVSVTLQFDKATCIHQIDIGNDGSAFVEVLVGKSTSKDEDLQVILVASSFMTPLDSRAGKNMTSVRMFGPDKLSKAVSDQKWDRVKVVCTQPFNKTIQYGLSFIKFHSPPGEGATTPQSKQGTLGGFKLKGDDSDSIKPGTLFSNRDKEKTSPAPLTGAAAVRAASKLAEDAQKATSKDDKLPATPQVKRKRADDEVPSSSSKTPSADRGSSQSAKTPLRKQSTSISSTTSSVTSAHAKGKDDQPPMKKTKSEPAKSNKDVSFHKIMKKVVFVMSGFQNPDRGNLRDKAMEMGADYSPDWGKRCTHLICAFENTPKYVQVKGKGRIVKREWIVDCYKAKRLLPWRKYRLGRAQTPPDGSSSSDSDDDVPTKSKPAAAKKSPAKSEAARSSKKSVDNEDSDPYGGDTDVGDSGEDTEDEIKRIKDAEKKQTPQKVAAPQAKGNGIENGKKKVTYETSTDEDAENGTVSDDNGDDNGGEDLPLPELPDYFKGRKFFFYGKLDEELRRKLNRYVVAYNGGVERYMTDSVSYVLTESDWDDNFDQALSDNPGISFIKPDWVFACDKKQKLLPYQKYVVVPK